MKRQPRDYQPAVSEVIPLHFIEFAARELKDGHWQMVLCTDEGVFAWNMLRGVNWWGKQVPRR